MVARVRNTKKTTSRNFYEQNANEVMLIDPY